MAGWTFPFFVGTLFCLALYIRFRPIVRERRVRPWDSAQVAPPDHHNSPLRVRQNERGAGTTSGVDAAGPEVSATWVPPQNLRPFIETISRWTGYAFDDTDWLAISDGVATTDADAGQWYSYPMCGVPRFDIEVAQNVDDEPVSIRVLANSDVSDVLRAQIRAAAEIFNSYDLT